MTTTHTVPSHTSNPAHDSQRLAGRAAFAHSETVKPNWDSRDPAFRSGFVQAWMDTKSLKYPLDEEKAQVIGAELHKDILVSAGAGSGKTTSLVYRALFLIEQMHIDPKKILALVFNVKARETIEGKVKDHFDQICGRQSPHIHNFHQLGKAFCEQKSIRLLGKNVPEILALDFIANILSDSENSYNPFIRWFSEQDRQQIDTSNLEKIKITKDCLGEEVVVKSHGESLIAEFLNHINSSFEDSQPVRWEYEKKFLWEDRPYHPDFTVLPKTPKGKGLVIEYFGMTGDKVYDQQTRDKTKYWKSQPSNWVFLPLYPHDIASGRYQRKILEDLVRIGVIPEDIRIPIFHPANDGVEYLPSLAKNLLKFVHLRRVNKRGPEDSCESQLSPLLHQINAPSRPEEDTEIPGPDPRAQRDELKKEVFQQIAQEFYRRYLEYLRLTRQEDFDGSLIVAEEMLQSPKTKYPAGFEFCKDLEYILIDEFQDYSLLYRNLVEAIRRKSQACHLFCVGDDWQAINGFAGSDTRFFREMENAPDSDVAKYKLRVNHRSGQEIVEAANQMMAPNPPSVWRTAAKAGGEVHLLNMKTFRPDFREKQNPGCPYLAAVARIVRAHPGRKIAVLSRANQCPNGMGVSTFQMQIKKLTGQTIHASTVHKVKGLEYEIVIVLDAIDGRFPLHHPDAILFDESRQKTREDHRCLLYVAMTRAEEKLFLFTDSSEASEFLPLEKDYWNTRLDACELLKNKVFATRNKRYLSEREFEKVNAALKANRFEFDRAQGRWEKRIALDSPANPEDGLSKILDKVLVYDAGTQ